jgi:hypothetical protein
MTAIALPTSTASTTRPPSTASRPSWGAALRATSHAPTTLTWPECAQDPHPRIRRRVCPGARVPHSSRSAQVRTCAARAPPSHVTAHVPGQLRHAAGSRLVPPDGRGEGEHGSVLRRRAPGRGCPGVHAPVRQLARRQVRCPCAVRGAHAHTVAAALSGWTPARDRRTCTLWRA